MRALTARPPAGPAAVELVDVAPPEPGPGQLRVSVEAAAVNPVDVAVTTGVLVELGLTPPRERVGLGWDVAGTVDAVGPGVDVAVGAAVVGLADLLGRPLKTHAEQVVLDAVAVAPAPRGVDPVPAATVALNGLTAAQALAALALPAGASVLVTGAAGAVGGFAVEIAHHRGLRVVAVADPADGDLVRGFGADAVVPRGADLAVAVRELVPGGVDGLVDAAVLGAAAQEAVRNGGGQAHLAPGPLPPALRGIAVHRVFVRADAARLAELVELVERGGLTPRVAATHPLSDAAAAYRRVAAGGLRGRVVLVP
ncbi:zinc-binding dehydrogenase [Pseudonocardia lacus]|uniref:zinc-binding dehydrogenase n=1 Tax=Pseudonocardia lacus TaxID=2835865 RepID=UPI001BDC2491|nr:zinc-binding dehydrogenase [Pseudonocardia lacus]